MLATKPTVEPRPTCQIDLDLHRLLARAATHWPTQVIDAGHGDFNAITSGEHIRDEFNQLHRIGVCLAAAADHLPRLGWVIIRDAWMITLFAPCTVDRARSMMISMGFDYRVFTIADTTGDQSPVEAGPFLPKPKPALHPSES